MKALEIFTQDITDREAGNALPRQQYYTAMRDALHRELMQQGYSDLVEELLMDIRSGAREKIYVLDYAALMECHSMIVLGREMRDAEEFVPHLHLRGEKARWSALEKPGSFLMGISKEMTEKIRQLRAVSRQLVDARDDTVLPQADDAAQREIEQVHQLNKLLEERCRSLQQERDTLRTRLELAENGIITEHVRLAIEGRRMQEEEALRRTYAARQEEASAAYRARYAQELAHLEQRQADAARALQPQRQEAAGDYIAAREHITGDLRQMMQHLEGQLAAWERRLDAPACRMLAQCYAALHDLQSNLLPQLLLDAQCTGADEALHAGLMTLQTQLRSRVQQLEQTMLRLGLVILRPAPGDAFDGAVHLPTGTSLGAVGEGTIAACLRPGVLFQGTGEALLKAEVALGDAGQ